MKTILRLPFLLTLFLAASCCHFPYNYSADSNTKSVKVVITSPTAGEVYLGGSFERLTLSPAVTCPPKLLVAPVGTVDMNGTLHFGAFAIKHGPSNERATIFWWSSKGRLRRHEVDSPDHREIHFSWINDRVIRFQFNHDSKSIRINEDDGQEYTEL